MGGIVYWTLLRIAILIPLLWLAMDYIDYKFWWIIFSMSVYGVIIQPAVIQYRLFMEKNKDVISNSLCTSCKHFDETAVLCLKYDEHPTDEEVPCDGIDWQPK